MAGTSVGNTIDKHLVRWARAADIPSVSIIDHWSWYLKRFKTQGGLLFPDWIIVNDKIAYESACSEGIPIEKLIIGGHPVLESLRPDTLNVKVKKGEIKRKLGLPNKRIVVFVSEEFRSIFRGTKEDPGYDEFTVLNEITEMLSDSDHLVIKKHPEERPREIPGMENRKDLNYQPDEYS